MASSTPAPQNWFRRLKCGHSSSLFAVIIPFTFEFVTPFFFRTTIFRLSGFLDVCRNESLDVRACEHIDFFPFFRSSEGHPRPFLHLIFCQPFLTGLVLQSILQLPFQKRNYLRIFSFISSLIESMINEVIIRSSSQWNFR